MANQTGKNIIVAYKVEATLNTAPGATGAKQLRLTPSPGLSLRRELIRSNEVRNDGMTGVPRLGSRMDDGSYSGELSTSSFDEIIAAIVRATQVAAVSITDTSASLASISFGTNTVTATVTSTGSGWLQAGIRVGDVFRVTATGGANDNINAQVRAVTTHTLTVNDAAYTVEAGPITSFVFSRGKKISNGTTPIRNSFYIDQYLQDIDVSTVFGGCRFTGFDLRGTPNGMAELTVGVMGMSATALASGASPYYTTPTEYTSDSLVMADAVIAFAGSTDVTVLTAVEVSYQINTATLPVIGSTTTPDVFDGEARLTGSVTMLVEDLDNLSNYTNETELELFILLQENEAVPKDYIGLYIPLLKIGSLEAPLGGDGAMTETIQWEAGMQTGSTSKDQAMLTFTTSAA